MHFVSKISSIDTVASKTCFAIYQKYRYKGYNPLTTDDAFWRRQFLAACYKLAQSVLKIGSAVAERVGQGEVGGCIALAALADSAWRRLQLAALADSRGCSYL